MNFSYPPFELHVHCIATIYTT